MEAAGPSKWPRPPILINGWIILDRYAHSRDGDVGDEYDDVTASEIADTCSGRRIRVSLRVADPPAVSRLYIHRLDGPWPDVYDLDHAEVVAAHNGSILFSTGVPFDDPDFVAPGHFPVDYFVYTASSSPARPPSLTRLPPCFIDGFSDPVEDEYYKPYQVQRQRIMLDENIGFLSHIDGGEFMVADIRNCDGYSLELCILNHHNKPPSVSERDEPPPQWRIQRLEMHHPSVSEIGHKFCKWVNDLVLPLHDRYLCCVDFFKGILLIDTNDLQHFSYIPLPEEAMHGCRIDEDDPDPARRVSVTGTGFIRLVCIDSVVIHGKTKSFTIKSWDLPNIHERTWHHNFTMGSKKFWRLCAKNHRLPRAPPSFPVVNLVDPHAISFLLKDDDKDLYWIVEIDMIKKALRSPAVLYINAEEEEEKENECCGDRCKLWKSFCGHYFIPSWFTTYLPEDPIQSRKRSETMQKAKQESTMHMMGGIGCKQRMEMLRQEKEKQESAMLESIDWKLMATDPMKVLRSLQSSH